MSNLLIDTSREKLNADVSSLCFKVRTRLNCTLNVTFDNTK